ncbi:GNAT family N-acetyltransferase [Agathobaculum sp. Marseille-P7918]|uniref:GNAT family N-acetyltransferase n=1 Tax=Agathobaculum sp. Marseille-P7918 TaxID=2479843 RepID=UPI000F637521|nr:GNAT family N-acetyltransferase [Agathobaculum sp. Marseille-P7918]
MEQQFVIRQAAAQDAAALLEIYRPFITDTVVTFEYEVPAAAEFAARITDTLAFFPYLVCERDGKPVGYAYAHHIRERAAYDWAVELSIYLAPEAQGQGVGTVLYQCLIDLLGQQNIRILYGCVTLPNEGSRRLHEKLGFALTGVWHGSGWKFGQWHDVGWFEKRLGGDGPAQPVVAFPALEPKKIQECLCRYTAMLKDGGLN